MDPMSIAAAIAGFLSLIKETVDVINDIKGASDAWKVLRGRLVTLRESLASVRLRILQAKNIELEIAANIDDRERLTGNLFQRYHNAIQPNGLYQQTQECLQDLFNEETRSALGKSTLGRRNRLFWTWKKEEFRAKVDVAIELVRGLRDVLDDDDAQLSQTNLAETTRVRRSLDEAETMQILNWIYPSGHQPNDVMASKYSSVLPIPDPFIISDPIYKQWVDDASSAHWHLNCFGDPGAGKSHRARTVIFNLSDRFERDEVPVLFIMFNQANESNQSLRAVYRRLLRQLFAQRPRKALPPNLRKLWDGGRLDGQDGPSEAQAREVLVDELKKLDRKFIIADALDEATGCYQSIRAALTGLRKNAKASIFSTARLDPKEDGNVTIMCSECGEDANDLYWTCDICTGSLSRRIDLCRECYQDKGIRCNDASHEMHIPERVNIKIVPTSKEIEDFVARSLQMELALDDSGGDDNALFQGFTPSLAHTRKLLGYEWDLIPKLISGVADGSYLIADLAIKQLKAQKNVYGFRNVLEGFESGKTKNYEDQYSNMLALSMKKRSRESQRLAYDHFALVSCANDLLSFEQLAHAVAIHRGDKSIADFADRCYTKQEVRKETSGLLTIGDFGNPEHETVSFFHRTLGDYLKERGNEWFPDGDQMMFNACVAYLQLEIFSNPFDELKELDKVLKEYPFASYAASFWGVHLRKIPRFGNENIVHVLEMLNDKNRKTALIQIALQGSASADLAWDVQQHVSTLQICAFNGLEDLCSILIDNGEDVDCLEESYGQTALHYACRFGHIAVVRVLLDAKANPNIASDKQLTPLMEAIESGHMDVVDLLLKHSSIDINIDAGGAKKPTALTLASEKGKVEFVKKLIEHPSIKVNKSDGWGHTALACAVRCPSAECVGLLLKHPRIDTAAKNSRIGMPLDHIAYLSAEHFGGQDETITSLFLQHRDVPVLEGTSLQYLIEDQRYSLVRLLLEGQSYHTWRDVHGRSLLHIAAASTFDSQILLLIYEHLSDLENFDIDAPDVYGCTALHAACSRFDTDGGVIADLLLQLGAKATIVNNERKTPIDVAFENVPESLHDTIKDIFLPYLTQGTDTWTWTASVVIPLERIIATGNKSRVEEAVRLEPTPLRSTPDPYTGWTVLHWTMYARTGPQPDLISILLPKATSLLNTVTHTGRTPLHTATKEGSDTAVDILVKAGAALEIKDQWGDTAFVLAQRSNNPQSAFRLIQAGAVIQKETINKNLLHQAVTAGNLEVVKRLVDVGVDIYHRRNGTGPTSLGLAKLLHKEAVAESRYNLAASGQWRNYTDTAAFDAAALAVPEAKALENIIDYLQGARRSETRRRIQHNDLSALIQSLRDYDESSTDESDIGSPWSMPRKGSDSFSPSVWSGATLRPGSDPSLARRRSRSRSPMPPLHHRISGPTAQSTNERPTGVDRTVLLVAGIVVAGIVIIAHTWLNLHYRVYLTNDPRGRSEI